MESGRSMKMLFGNHMRSATTFCAATTFYGSATLSFVIPSDRGPRQLRCWGGKPRDLRFYEPFLEMCFDLESLE
jgi:hypothetical protein